MTTNARMTRPLVDVDLSRFELLAASLNESGQPVDLYKAEAAKCFGVTEDKVTPEMRRAVKQRAFFKLYTPSK